MRFDHRADPNGVLAFLVEALQATEDAGQRAWISGHISPGHLDMMHDQVSSRVKLVVWTLRLTLTSNPVQLLRSDYSTVQKFDLGPSIWT